MADDTVQKVTIDSTAARADLDALAKSLAKAGAAAAHMNMAIGKGVDASNQALVKGAKNMETFAKVATTVSKIKLSGDISKQLRDFTSALNGLARVREISPTTLQSFSKFLQVGYQAQRIKFASGAFSGIESFVKAMDSVGRARAVRPTALKSFVDFIEIAARAQQLRFSPQTAGSLTTFAKALDAIGQTRGVTPAKVASVKALFDVLRTAKGVPNADRIARELDQVAAAAARAGTALRTLPNNLGTMATRFNASAKAVSNLHKPLAQTPGHAQRAHRGLSALGVAVGSLTGRFNLAYQAGTVFSAMFSAFTIGQFIKGVYDATISMQKLEKAMLFVTGTYDEATKASNRYLALADRLGMRALQNADAFSRFAISSSAIGANISDVENIFRATVTALTSVGATSQQTEYAFYGLSQAMAKGKISSEEFNRQIGEQIPGNVAAGVKALSRLRGQSLTAADLFDEMKKGAIQSLPFLRLWGEEIEKMFAPLLPVAEKRPDFQLNRLINAFDRFKIAVGNSEFIGELTIQFKRLADIFVLSADQGGGLTDVGKKLASSFGRGLADAVRMLGDAIAYLVDNLDTVVMSIKGLLALGIASMFAKWSTSATAFAQSMLMTAGATLQAAGATKALSTAQATNVQTGFAGRMAAISQTGRAGVQGTAPTILATSQGASYNRLRDRGLSHGDALFYAGPQVGMTQSPEFWRRGDVAASVATSAAAGGFGRRNAVSAGSTQNAAAVSRASSNVAQGLGKVGSAMASFGRMLPGLGTLLAGGAIALAMFGNSVTEFKTKTGEAVTYMDIFNAGLDGFGTSINNWIKSVTQGSVDFEQAGLKFGGIVAALIVSFRAVFGTLFNIADAIGRVFGQMIANVVDVVVKGITAVGLALRGDFSGARELITTGLMKGMRGMGEQFAQTGRNLAETWDLGGNLQAVLQGASQNADRRSAAERAAQEKQAADATIEAALAQQRASDEQLRAAADMAKAVNMFSESIKPLTFYGDEGVFTDIMRLIKEGPVERTTGEPTVRAGAPASQAASSVRPAASTGGSLEIAQSMLGLQEKRDNATLKSFFTTNGISIDPEKTAWCAAFVNAVLAQQGIKGTGTLRAADFNQFGTAVSKDQAQAGDIVVLKPNQGGGTSGHVGFLSGFDRHGSPIVVGGNQSNAVTKATFRADQVASYRRAGQSTGSMPGVDETDGLAPNQQLSLYERRYNQLRNVNVLAGGGSPYAAALADQQEFLEKLRDAYNFENDFLKQAPPGTKSLFEIEGVTKQLEDAWARLEQKAADALNPLAKEARLMAQGNDALLLRTQGMNAQADLLEYLNQQKEDGLAVDLQTATATMQVVQAEKNRTSALESQLDLIKMVNDLEVARAQRRGNFYDATVTSLVAGRAQQGESISQAMERLGGSGELDILQQQAGIMDLGRREDVQFRTAEDLAEITAMSRLSSSRQSYRSDYKAYLQDLTGSTSQSLATLEAQATEADKAWAKYAADIKYAAENPPGFQRWADSLEPFSERLQDIKAGFMEEFSDGIASALMGEDVDWGSIAKNFTKELIKARVDEALKNVINSVNGGGGFMGAVKGLFGFGGGEAQAPLQPEDKLQASVTTFDQSCTSFSSAVQQFSQLLGAPGGGAISTAGTQPYSLPTAASIAVNAANDNAGEITLQGQGPSVSVSPMDLVSANSIEGVQPFNPGPLTTAPQVSASALKKPGLLSRALGAYSKGTEQLGAPMAALGGLNTVLDILGVGKASGPDYAGFNGEAGPGWDGVKGIVGTMGGVQTDATMVAAKENPWAQALNFGLNLATGGAYGTYSGFANMIGSTIGRFEEGGLATNPVERMFVNAPHFAEGTPNTSGGMPAIVHPDEAIIPLSRGRKIPVEMGDEARTSNTTINSPMIIYANDADSFRQSQASIQRKQNLAMKRSATRNLTGR